MPSEDDVRRVADAIGKIQITGGLSICVDRSLSAKLNDDLLMAIARVAVMTMDTKKAGH